MEHNQKIIKETSMANKLALVNKNDDKVTANKLRHILWDTLNKLRDGEIDVAKADAISRQAKGIVDIVHSQHKILTSAKMDMTKEVIDYAKG